MLNTSTKYSDKAASVLQEALSSVTADRPDWWPECSSATRLKEVAMDTDCPHGCVADPKHDYECCDHGYLSAMESINDEQMADVIGLIREGY